MKRAELIFICGALLAIALVGTADARGGEENEIRILRTPSGVRFGILGEKARTPAPTLFVFAVNIEDTLRIDEFNKVGHILARDGYLCVSLDVPCHGTDAKTGEEANTLNCWRIRLEKGDALLPEYLAKASAVLDYLIMQGFTDPQKVAASGTSRGGFIALHFAAADPRVRCVAAFAPVTNLLVLREFAGLEGDSVTVRKIKALALVNSAQKLAGRSIWVCIGNYDRRVGTDEAIAFSRRVVEASVAQNRPANVEVHILPSFGYQARAYNDGHQIPIALAHEEAAAWIEARTRESN